MLVESNFRYQLIMPSLLSTFKAHKMQLVNCYIKFCSCFLFDNEMKLFAAKPSSIDSFIIFHRLQVIGHFFIQIIHYLLNLFCFEVASTHHLNEIHFTGLGNLFNV